METNPVKIIKCTLYIIDINRILEDCKDVEPEIQGTIEDQYSCISNVFDCESVTVQWHDGIDLNQIGAAQEEYEAYFRKDGE